jgi:hypothetical protein
MNILNGFDFMMPTQAPDAIVLDGTLLIILGFLALAYLLYRHRHVLLDVDANSVYNPIDNKNMNTQRVIDNNPIVNAQDNSQKNTQLQSNGNMEKSAIRNKESDGQKSYRKNEKEVILNHR